MPCLGTQTGLLEIRRRGSDKCRVGMGWQGEVRPDLPGSRAGNAVFLGKNSLNVYVWYLTAT